MRVLFNFKMIDNRPILKTRSTKSSVDLVTITGDIIPDFIPEQERHHNPTMEPGEIQLCIDREGELITQAFYRIGLVFALRRSEIPKWSEALTEMGFRWVIRNILTIDRNDGQRAEDYNDRDRAIINNILTSNDSLKTLVHTIFNSDRGNKNVL